MKNSIIYKYGYGMFLLIMVGALAGLIGCNSEDKNNLSPEKDNTIKVIQDSLCIRQVVKENVSDPYDRYISIETFDKPYTLETSIFRHDSYGDSFSEFLGEYYNSEFYGTREEIDSVMCIELNAAKAKLKSIQIELNDEYNSEMKIQKDLKYLNNKKCK